jgi:hypothetical protein
MTLIASSDGDPQENSWSEAQVSKLALNLTTGSCSMVLRLTWAVEQTEEIFASIDFWEKAHGQQPGIGVFDSKLITYTNLGRLAERQKAPPGREPRKKWRRGLSRASPSTGTYG